MSKNNKTFYVTTPIYYVNDIPHVGHAYTTFLCDFLARFKRLDGYDVYFLTGTDEHGQKNAKTAQAKGMSPQAFVDQLSMNFRRLNEEFHITNTDFIRTTQERNVRAAQALWQKMKENGHIYLGKYSGWYSVRDEAYFSNEELIDGKAPTGSPVEWVEEESYFFNLSKWQEPLLKHYQENPTFIMPRMRQNEVVSFVQSGLRDLSISRTSFTWGAPVPGDEAHVMYVWLDALANYLAGVSYPDERADLYQKFWPADWHIVGKDILRFHAVYWPAFLMAVGLPLPKQIYAHGWWTIEGQKISKSVGNTIDPLCVAEKYGRDQLRYFLLREKPVGSDGDFSHDAVVRRINSDLANDYGNLVQRVLSFIYKNRDQVIPGPNGFLTQDEELLNEAKNLLPQLYECVDQLEVHKYGEVVWRVISLANQYIENEKPWALRKLDPARMDTVLYTLAEVIRILTIFLQPMVPEAAHRILSLLGIGESERSFASLTHSLKSGLSINEPKGIFPRLENKGDKENVC